MAYCRPEAMLDFIPAPGLQGLGLVLSLSQDVFEVSLATGPVHGLVLDVTVWPLGWPLAPAMQDPDCTIVKGLKADGTAATWNLSAAEGRSIKARVESSCEGRPWRKEFDRILEVNGVKGSSVELAKALGTETVPRPRGVALVWGAEEAEALRITFQRPELRKVRR